MKMLTSAAALIPFIVLTGATTVPLRRTWFHESTAGLATANHTEPSILHHSPGGLLPLCCASVKPAGSVAVQALMDLIGASNEGVAANVPVGISCAPINATSHCAAIPAICEDDRYEGKIAIGCTRLRDSTLNRPQSPMFRFF